MSKKNRINNKVGEIFKNENITNYLFLARNLNVIPIEIGNHRRVLARAM